MTRKTESTKQKVSTTVDPVCGMNVNTDSQFHEKYNDQEYYFCSDYCQERFKEDPAKYAEDALRSL